VPGATLVTAGLVLAVAGFARAVRHPWTDRWTLALLIAAAVLLTAFSAQQMRAASPLAPVGWLAARGVLVSVTTLLLASFALFAAIFLVSLYLQDVRGYAAVQAGVRMLPLTLTTLVIAPLAGKAAVCRGPAGVLLAGLALTGGATISLTWLGPASGYSWFGARLAMLGVGLALALPTVVALLINRVPAGQAGVASGLVTMSRQFGGALGLAVPASIGSRVAGDTFTRRTGLGSLRGPAAGGQISDTGGSPGRARPRSPASPSSTASPPRCGSPPQPWARPCSSRSQPRGPAAAWPRPRPPLMSRPPALSPARTPGPRCPRFPMPPVPGHPGAAARGDRAAPGSSPASATSGPAQAPVGGKETRSPAVLGGRRLASCRAPARA